jgi:hypothetical protein
LRCALRVDAAKVLVRRCLRWCAVVTSVR